MGSVSHDPWCHYARVETSKTPGCPCDLEFAPEDQMIICANCATEMFLDEDNIYRCPSCGETITATKDEPEPATEDK